MKQDQVVPEIGGNSIKVGKTREVPGGSDAGLAQEWPRESDAGPKEAQVAQPGR